MIILLDYVIKKGRQVSSGSNVSTIVINDKNATFYRILLCEKLWPLCSEVEKKLHYYNIRQLGLYLSDNTNLLCIGTHSIDICMQIAEIWKLTVRFLRSIIVTFIVLILMYLFSYYIKNERFRNSDNLVEQQHYFICILCR